MFLSYGPKFQSQTEIEPFSNIELYNLMCGEPLFVESLHVWPERLLIRPDPSIVPNRCAADFPHWQQRDPRQHEPPAEAALLHSHPPYRAERSRSVSAEQPRPHRHAGMLLSSSGGCSSVNRVQSKTLNQPELTWCLNPCWHDLKPFDKSWFKRSNFFPSAFLLLNSKRCCFPSYWSNC